MGTVQEEIIANVVTTVIEDTIKGAWKKVREFFKDLDAKEAILYGKAYEEYLINTSGHYGKVKTLIYRHVPKDLYSFFECTDVLYDGVKVDTSSIMNLLEIDKRIIVSGSGGMGKSTMFRHLFLNTIKETARIPVYIELRSFNSQKSEEISVEDTVYSTLVHNGFTLSREYFKYSMEIGAYIIFFDGYDEVSRENAQAVTDQIRSLCSLYCENNYFLSSRPTDRFIGWSEFVEVKTEPLTKKQALSLVNKIQFDDKVKKRFFDELKGNLFDKHRSFASNPLLLNIMLLTFSDHATFPEKLNDFYEQAFLALFNMHDATKDSYVRDIRSGLGHEDFKTVFSYFCFKSYFNGEYEFTEPRLRELINNAKEKFPSITFKVDAYLDDLLISVCMVKKDGLKYCFSHRSFQEYFAALYTCKIEDSMQKKLLAAWLDESRLYETETYLGMLYDMQPEKVNKLVFSPVIKRVKRKYEKCGAGVAFLSSVIYRVQIFGLEKDLGVSFSDDDMHILCRACNLNKPDLSSDVDEYRAETHSTVEALLAAKINSDNSFTFEEAIGVVGEDTILMAFSWVEKYVKYAIELVEKLDRKMTNKKTVSAILGDL